jgi:hypothetical protein
MYDDDNKHYPAEEDDMVHFGAFPDADLEDDFLGEDGDDAIPNIGLKDDEEEAADAAEEEI